MRYKRFGRTDMKFSVIGLGAWQAGMKSWGKNYTRKDVIEAMNTAFNLGVNFIDTAEIYGYGESERLIAGMLKEWKDVYVATKVAGYNACPGKITKSVEDSLRRLGRDIIDLYQIHWPPSYYTSLCKVFWELETLVDKGLIRYIGVSNFSKGVLEKSVSCMKKHEIVSNQIQYNLLFRPAEKRLIPYMKKMEITVIAWSPIEKGALAGKKKADALAKLTDATFLRVRKAEALLKKMQVIAERRDISLAQVALAWLLAKDVFPIPGAKNPSQARENTLAGDIILSDNETRILDEASEVFIKGRIKSVMPRYIPSFLQKLVITLLRGI